MAVHPGFMSTLTTQLFRFLTPCDAETVWRVLTPSHGEDGRYYGAPVASDWQVGSTVTIGCDSAGPRLVGEVLAAEPGSRLSHTLGDRIDEPAVYVTWTLPSPATDHPSLYGRQGTVVRLYIDDTGAGGVGDPGDDGIAAESAWLPVLAAVQAELDRCMR